MANNSKALPFVAGLAIGGLLGGIGGYVVNDLTSKENPEVMEEIRQTQQTQQELDQLFDDLGSSPPAGNAAPAPEPE